MGSSKNPHDATRQERKAKKRKLEDAVPDLPGDNDNGEVEGVEKKNKKRKRDKDAEENGVIDEEKGSKERKKEKKRRRKEAEEGGVSIQAEVEGEVEGKVEKKTKDEKEKKDKDSTTTEPEIEPEVAGEAEARKKSKKERKAERRAAEAAKSKDAVAAPGESKFTPEEKAEAKTNGDAEREKKSKKNNRNREKKRKAGSVTATSEGGAAVNGDGDGEKAEIKEKKDARFICFIGNLPFTANTQSITKHFAPVKPISVRALTQKDDPSKSKGIAFIEFDGYDHMKTCLKMFHHSMFDDGLSAPRKINVELTAGGGGNTKARQSKIQEKNVKLNEQRARRMQEEAKIKLEKSSNAGAIDESAIHPSRRTRVPGV